MLISRLYELEADPPVAAGPGAPNYRVDTAPPGREPTAADPPRPSSLPLPARESADHRLAQKPGRSCLAQKPGRSSRPVPVTPPVTPVPEPNLPEPNQTADLTPAAATPHAGDGAGAGNRAPRTATTPPPDSGPPEPPGRHRQSADTKGLSRPPLCLLVGSTNSRPIRRSRPAQGRRTTGSSPRDPAANQQLQTPRVLPLSHFPRANPQTTALPKSQDAAALPKSQDAAALPKSQDAAQGRCR